MGGKHDLYEKRMRGVVHHKDGDPYNNSIDNLELRRMPENPIAIVHQGSHLLDRAWAQINTLNAIDCPEGSYYRAINQALSIIESLGGKDPLKRKHDRGES